MASILWTHRRAAVAPRLGAVALALLGGGGSECATRFSAGGYVLRGGGRAQPLY